MHGDHERTTQGESEGECLANVALQEARVA